MPRAERAYWGALVLALALGAFLRLNGFLFGRQSSLWLDEALWAPRFVNWPLLKLGIRPLGYVWLTRQLVGHFGATEFWFRFLSGLGGIASLLLMPYLASRFVSSRALRVLFVLLFAIHPALIDLSKEFKPYSFEVLVHALTVALYLRYEQTRKPGYLYALLAFLPLSFLLAYNMAFALPSLLLLAFWAGVERRLRVLIGAALLSAALCGATVYAIHGLSLERIERDDKAEDYWGRKYDVFYRESPERGRLAWTLGKTADTAAMIGLSRELWTRDQRLSSGTAEKLEFADRALWVALAVAGAVAVLRKNRRQALLLLMPFAVLVLVNALGKWPLGQFRANLFICVYALPLPLLALQMLRDLVKARAAGFLLGVVVLDALAGFAFTVDWQGRKRLWTQEGNAREIIRALSELRQQELADRSSRRTRRARLVLDLFSSKPLDYYRNIHPTFSAKYAELWGQFDVDKVSSKQLANVARRRLNHSRKLVYAIAAKPSSASALRALMAENPDAVVRKRVIAENVMIAVLDD